MFKHSHFLLAMSLLVLSSYYGEVHGQGIFKQVQDQIGFSDLENNNGVAVADYDGDYDLDVFVVAYAKEIKDVDETYSKLFRNNNDGTFTDVTSAAGLGSLLKENELDESYDSFIGLAGYKYGAFWGIRVNLRDTHKVIS